MLVGPSRTRDLAVGDLADEQVPEGVLALAPDRRLPVASDELPPLELVQAALEPPALVAGDGGERAEPEDLAEDGGVLQQRLLAWLERVEPGGDNALYRLGQCQLARNGAALGQHPRELLGVERVAAGVRDERALHRCRQHRPAE